MKGLMKACSVGSVMWRGSRGVGLPRESMWDCAGSHSVGRPRKRWIDTMKKSGLDVRKARRMVQTNNVWRGFVRGNVCGPRDEPLTLTRYHSC